MTKLTEQWINMIDDCNFDNGMTRTEVAIMLENQMLHNETLNDVEVEVGSHPFVKAFQRLSLPIVFRTLRNIKLPHFINFQPTMVEDVESHLMKVCFIDPVALNATNNLDTEADIVAFISQELALELDFRVLNEIKHNAGTVTYIDPSLTDFTTSFFDTVRSSEVSPNWVIASSEITELLTEWKDFEPAKQEVFTWNLGIQYLGTLHNFGVHLELFENKLSPNDELLLGRRRVDSLKIIPRVLLECFPMGSGSAKINSQFNLIMPEEAKKLYTRITVKAPE